MHYYRVKFDINEKPVLPGIALTVDEFCDLWLPAAKDPSIATGPLFAELEQNITYWYECLTHTRPWGIVFFSLLPTIQSQHPMRDIRNWVKNHDVPSELRFLWFKCLRREHARQEFYIETGSRNIWNKQMTYRISRMYVYMLGHAIRDWSKKYNYRKRYLVPLDVDPACNKYFDIINERDMYLDCEHDWYTTYALDIVYTDQEDRLALVLPDVVDKCRSRLNEYKKRVDREWNSI